MKLYQPDEGYCYNSDSIVLYGFINRFCKRGTMLDVGAGCGVIGLLVARDNSDIKMHGIEKQKIFIDYIQKNVEINNLSYTLYHDDFLKFNSKQQFDHIVSNPPFYHDGASRSSNEIINNARYSFNLPMKDFFKKVSELLTPKGHFVFCYDAKQFALVCGALEEVNLRVVDVQFVHSKTNRSASVVMIHVRNNSRSLLNVLPPFITFNGNSFSDEMLSLYEQANTESIKCQI